MPSLANIHRLIAAGFARVDCHRTDSGGLPAGSTGTIVAGATGAAPFRIKLVKTANINVPAADGVPVTGDNTLAGTFIFPSIAARSFDISFAEDDYDDRNPAQSIVPRDVGNMSFAGRDISPFNINNLMFIGVSNAKAQASGILNLGMYSGIFAMRAQMVMRGRNTFAERAAADVLATIVLDPQDTYPWGETFKTSVEGYTQSFVEDWANQYPVTCHRWQQSGGALTQFFLSERPASTSLSDVLVYVIDAAGTAVRQTSGVTISQTDNSITFSIAPGSGRDIIAFYSYS